MVPILDDRALPDQFASNSENVALYSQILQGFAIPRRVYTLAKPTTKFVFRIPNSYTDIELYDPSFWMEFDHPDTSVIHTPTVEDRFDRYYWVEPGKPPQYNTADRIRSHLPPYILGIPAPAVKPGVTSSGGTSTVSVGRTYLYTWASAYGEEGQPSPVTTHNGLEDDIWHLTFTLPTGTQLADRDLVTTNIYRTVTSTNGVATYFLVNQDTDRAAELRRHPDRRLHHRQQPAAEHRLGAAADDAEGHGVDAQRDHPRLGRHRRLVLRAVPASCLAFGLWLDRRFQRRRRGRLRPVRGAVHRERAARRDRQPPGRDDDAEDQRHRAVPGARGRSSPAPRASITPRPTAWRWSARRVSP